MADENIGLVYLTPPDSMCCMHGYRARWYRGHSPTVWAPVPEVCRALRRCYEEAGIWELRGWAGGYELGIAFPPDWVGELVWTVEEQTEGTFRAGEVTNYESVLGTALIDSFVLEGARARWLTHFPAELIVVG
jgi:hypothetical protein